MRGPCMKDLEPGYIVEVDGIDKVSWHDLLPAFDDATFYQTWSYGEKSWGEKHLSHLLLCKDGRVVSIAQLRILRYPSLKTGVAYLNWGPLWKHRNERDHLSHLKNMIRALRKEYVENRGLVLRILPKIVSTNENHFLRELFLEEGYDQSPDPLRTFIVDLDPLIDDIKQNMHRSWKRSLKSAEKNNLIVKEVTGREQLTKIFDVYSQMKIRKKFFGNMQMDVLSIHEDLPDELKLKILLCYHQDEMIAALGWSRIGKIGIPLIGATGDKGLLFKASFLLWWEMIKYCKAQNADYCDTATVHEKRNPGGYFFKKGLAGKDVQEATYLGRYDAYKSYPAFLLLKAAMAAREKTFNTARRIKVWRWHRPIIGQSKGGIAQPGQ